MKCTLDRCNIHQHHAHSVVGCHIRPDTRLICVTTATLSYINHISTYNYCINEPNVAEFYSRCTPEVAPKCSLHIATGYLTPTPEMDPKTCPKCTAQVHPNDSFTTPNTLIYPNLPSFTLSYHNLPEFTIIYHNLP